MPNLPRDLLLAALFIAGVLLLAAGPTAVGPLPEPTPTLSAYQQQVIDGALARSASRAADGQPATADVGGSAGIQPPAALVAPAVQAPAPAQYAPASGPSYGMGY